MHYYTNTSRCRYAKCIASTFNKLEENVLELNQLLINNKNENIIIKKLFYVFCEKMKYELQNNETGVFGVTKAYFSDGVRWYYKNPIKKEFYQTYPIFANSLEEIKVKIKENNDFWFVLDGDKVKKQRNKLGKKRSPSGSVDFKKEINSKSKDHEKMRKEEKDKDKKREDLEKKLDLKENDSYKREIHKFFR